MESPRFIILILKNLHKRSFRYGVLILCVASVVCLQIASDIIESATKSGVRLGISRLGADLVAVPRGLAGDTMRSYQKGEVELFYMDRSLEERIKILPFVEKTSPQLYLRSLPAASCCSIHSTFLIGYDHQTDFAIRPWLNEHSDVEIGPDDIIVGPGVPTRKGKAVRFFGHVFNVAGVLEVSGTGIDRAVFIPIKTLNKIISGKEKLQKRIGLGKISSVLIKLRPEEEGGVPRWKGALELERAIKDITIIRPIKMIKKVHENLKIAIKTLEATSYAIWPLTALFIGLIFSMSSNERTREIGLLRAMGATRLFVFKMIMTEVILIAGIGAIAGVVASLFIVSGFSNSISQGMKLPISISSIQSLPAIIAVAAMLALLTGIISALIPALRASLKEPYEAIRKVE